MRKVIPIFVVFVLMISSSLAAMNPVPKYCEHQGYSIDKDGNCVFEDGNECPVLDFYSGKCGENYVKDFPCRNQGEVVFNFEECCDGLGPKSTGLSQATCEELDFFEKVWRWFAGLF
jgi:hypothetical protein